MQHRQQGILAIRWHPISLLLQEPGTQHHRTCFEMFNSLGLNRFAAGVITDICLTSGLMLEKTLKTFISKNGGMLSVTIASKQYQEIYEIAKATDMIADPKAASDKLLKYADIMV